MQQQGREVNMWLAEYGSKQTNVWMWSSSMVQGGM